MLPRYHHQATPVRCCKFSLCTRRRVAAAPPVEGVQVANLSSVQGVSQTGTVDGHNLVYLESCARSATEEAK